MISRTLFAKPKPRRRIVLVWRDLDYTPPKVLAAVWKNGVTDKSFEGDMLKARRYAAPRGELGPEGGRVYAFPMSEKKPLERATQFFRSDS